MKSPKITAPLSQRKLLIFALFITILLAVFFHLRVTTGSYQGRVLDPFNHPLEGIKVDFMAYKSIPLAFVDSGRALLQEAHVLTDSEGYFSIPAEKHILGLLDRMSSEKLSFSEVRPNTSLVPTIDNKVLSITDYAVKWHDASLTYTKRTYKTICPGHDFIDLESKPAAGEELTVILIPVVADIKNCSLFPDAENAEKCVALNAANVAVKTSNRELCRLSWSGGEASDCLDQLSPNKEAYAACDCLDLYGYENYPSMPSNNGTPEDLLQIKNPKHLCIAYCSWFLGSEAPLCEEIADKETRNICYKVHIQEHIRKPCEASNYTIDNEYCRFLKEHIDQ